MLPIENISTNNLAIELSHAVSKDEFRRYRRSHNWSLIFYDIVGLGLNVYFSVDGDTKYVIITARFGFVIFSRFGGTN